MGGDTSGQVVLCSVRKQTEKALGNSKQHPFVASPSAATSRPLPSLCSVLNPLMVNCDVQA